MICTLLLLIFFMEKFEGLAEARTVIFQEKDADICKVKILRNVNLAWVGTIIILHSLV